VFYSLNGGYMSESLDLNLRDGSFVKNKSSPFVFYSLVVTCVEA